MTQQVQMCLQCNLKLLLQWLILDEKGIPMLERQPHSLMISTRRNPQTPH